MDVTLYKINIIIIITTYRYNYECIHACAYNIYRQAGSLARNVLV